MKKTVIVIALLICLNAYCQEIPFKIVGGDIEWQKVYEKDLNIEPQTIFFSKPSKLGGIYINRCEQADLYVEKKDGRTRLRVKKFLFKPDLERVATIALTKKGFRKSFVKRDAKILEGMIQKTIDDLLEAGESDW